MSEETARTLEEARARATQRSTEAENRKRELLATIAREIPERVENLAKRKAHAQADVSKALGKDGIKKLRAELHDQATELATEVRAAVDHVKWPMWRSEFSPVSVRDLRSALFDYLYGRRVNSLAAIFKRHGFNIQDDNAQRAQGLVLPQDLFSEQEQEREFEAVAEALNALAAEERAVKEAEAVHNRDVVDSLWEDD